MSKFPPNPILPMIMKFGRDHFKELSRLTLAVSPKFPHATANFCWVWLFPSPQNYLIFMEKKKKEFLIVTYPVFICSPAAVA